MAEIKDFLSSKSMLTPGIAGGLVMLITTALQSQFSMPAAWVALALSFLVGTLVLRDKSTAIWQKAVLYLLNSLIIFSMATGANTTARAVEDKGPAPGFTNGPADSVAIFKPWFSSET